MAICKGLVEAHGGRIRAESGGVGLGMRFSFTIPVVQEASPGAGSGFARSSSNASRDGQERTRILVVDDDPQTLRYVRDALMGAGYVPLVTGDPREVSHLIKTKKPRLVLLDLMLPGTDGIELMEHIPEMADLPVIFISGCGRDETIARALEVGAVDYIVKPFSPTELMARIRAALRRRDEPPEPFRLRDLAIHYEARRVTVAGRPVQLTATEYELLRALRKNEGGSKEGNYPLFLSSTPPHLWAASLIPTINTVCIGNRKSPPFRLMFKASRNELGAFCRLARISAFASVPEDAISHHLRTFCP